MKNYDFVHEENELEIRKCQRKCKCRICDCEILGKDIVYMRSFRDPRARFRICLECWGKIDYLAKEYMVDVGEE